MPIKNLEIIKGDDQKYTLTFRDNKGEIDISFWTIFLKVKNRKTLALMIDKTITEHIDPEHGKSKIVLTNQETNIVKGRHNYSISVRTGAGEIYTVLYGAFIVRES